MTVALQAMGTTSEGRSVRCFEDLPVTGPTTVGALLARVAPEVAELMASGASVLVNGERATAESAVADGDEVSVIKTVAGG